MTAATSVKPGPSAGADRSPRVPRERSPADAAYAAMRSDRRLYSSAKVVASIIKDQLWSDDLAAAFPSSKWIARVAGWHHAKDQGVARVKRALALLCKLGYLSSMMAGDFWRWHREVGGPKLGLQAPKVRGNPRRFLVARWKRPDASPADWEPPEMVDRAHLPADKMVTGAPVDGAPSTITKGAPSTTAENGSKFEPSNRTEEEQNVTTRLRQGGPKTPNVAAAPPSGGYSPEERAARFVRRLRDRGVILQRGSDPATGAEVIRGGLLGEHTAPVSDDEKAEIARLRPQILAYLRGDPASACAGSTPQELLDNRVRRLAGAGPAGFDDMVVEDLAFDLARSIHDAHSIAYHGKVLEDLARGDIKSDAYFVALARARKAKKGDGGKAFATTIEPHRPGWKDRKKKRPAAGHVLATSQRPAPKYQSH